jgi:hypothetical protein
VSQNARKKRAFARRETVQLRRRLVAGHQPIAHEVLLNGLDRPEHARVRRGQEPDERHHQQAHVEQLRAVVLDARMSFVAAARSALPLRERAGGRR